MSRTIWVYDPDEGKEIPLNVRVNKRGDPVIKKLPDHNFSGGETPRLLEKKAAFIDIATTTFGQKWTGDRVPVWGALRREMPRANENFRNPRRSQREAKQARYRELMGPEILSRAVTMEALRRRNALPSRRARKAGRRAGPDPIDGLLANPLPPAKFPWPSERDRLSNRRKLPPPP